MKSKESIFEYTGQYLKELHGKYSMEKWVFVPKEKVHFLHKNTLSSDDITMGIFEENGVIYLMSYVFEEDKKYIRCALENVKKSNYCNVTEPEMDKKVNNSGFPYYEMDAIYYCEWCTRDR